MTMLSWSPRLVRAVHAGLGVPVLLLAACRDQLPTGPSARALAPQRDASVSPASDIFIHWQARERGGLASVSSVQPVVSWSYDGPTFNGHTIARCIGGNATMYFMRLPDGNEIDGTGFGQGLGTLTLLRDRGTPTSAIDGSATYTSWADYTATLNALIAYESAGQPLASGRVHAPDFTRSINFADQPDAAATADAVRQASIGIGWTNVWYTGYDVENRPINVSDAQHAVKDAEFQAHDAPVVAAGFFTNVGDPEYETWLWPTYFRQPLAGSASPNRVGPSTRRVTRAFDASRKP